MNSNSNVTGAYLLCWVSITGLNILILGGWRDGASVKAELVDKHGNSKVLPDLPQASNFATGGVFDDQPFLCGGNTGLDGTYHRKCFKLSTDILKWQHFATLGVARAFASSVILTEKIWISGGASQGEGGIVKNSITIDINGQISQGPSLQEPLCCHAKIAFQSRIMVIGGWDGKNRLKKTWIYNTNPSFEDEGPALNVARSSHGCCSVPSRNIIIVAGGDSTCKSVELLDYGKQRSSWHWQISKLITYNILTM